MKTKCVFSKSPAVWPGQGLISMPTWRSQCHLKWAWLLLWPLWVPWDLSSVLFRTHKLKGPVLQQTRAEREPLRPCQCESLQATLAPMLLGLRLGAAEVRQQSPWGWRPQFSPCVPRSSLGYKPEALVPCMWRPTWKTGVRHPATSCSRHPEPAG